MVFSVYNQQQSALNEESIANIALQCKQSGNMTDCTCTLYPDIIIIIIIVTNLTHP